MGSQTDLMIQHLEAAQNGTHCGDSNSDEAIFTAEPAKGKIVKTVGVIVTSDKRRKSVVRFEPI
jgi:hypothetical protein